MNNSKLFFFFIIQETKALDVGPLCPRHTHDSKVPITGLVLVVTIDMVLLPKASAVIIYH